LPAGLRLQALSSCKITEILMQLRVDGGSHSLPHRVLWVYETASSLQSGSVTSGLHDFWNSDAQPSESPLERPFDHGRRGQQESPARGVFFAEDVVAVIEVVEELG
jgi:hypothetical protein